MVLDCERSENNQKWLTSKDEHCDTSCLCDSPELTATSPSRHRSSDGQVFSLSSPNSSDTTQIHHHVILHHGEERKKSMFVKFTGASQHQALMSTRYPDPTQIFSASQTVPGNNFKNTGLGLFAVGSERWLWLCHTHCQKHEKFQFNIGISKFMGGYALGTAPKLFLFQGFPKILL